MSHPLKAVAIVAAISLGALVSLILPGGAEDKLKPFSAASVRQARDGQSTDSPPRKPLPSLPTSRSFLAWPDGSAPECVRFRRDRTPTSAFR